MKVIESYGSVEYHTEDGELVVDMLTIDKNARGSHLGYRLLDKVIDYARDNNISTVSLCAYPQEENGISQSTLMGYYRDYGFSSIDGTEIMEYSI